MDIRQYFLDLSNPVFPDIAAMPELSFALSHGITGDSFTAPISALSLGTVKTPVLAAPINPVLFTGDAHGDTQGTATAIIVGDTVNSIIDTPEDVDYFSFTLTAGQAILIEMTSPSSPFMHIVGADGLEDGSFGTFDLPTVYTADMSGTHYIYIYGADQDTYSFTISNAPAEIPGDISSTEVLMAGTPITSQADFNNDQDWFQFMPAMGDEVNFRLSTTFHVMGLYVYDDTGTQLTSYGQWNQTFDGGTGLYHYDLLYNFSSAATYYIGVDTDLAGSGTSYDLSVEIIIDDYPEDISTSGTVSLASPATGVTEHDSDQDWFAFSGTAGTNLVISVDFAQAMTDGLVQVFDSVGSLLNGGVYPLTFDGNGNRHYHFDIAATDTYFISVGGVRQDAMPIENLGYTLSLTTRAGDEAANITTGASTTIGGTYNGTFFAQGDIDFIEVSLTAGTAYVFTLSSLAGSVNIMNFRDSTGNYAFGNIQFIDDDYLFVPETTGTYYLDVANSTLPGQLFDVAYSVSSSVVPDDHSDNMAGATVTNPYEVTFGVEEHSDDTDWFRFTLGSDEDLYFTTDNILFYTFYDAGGNVVGNSSYGNLADLPAGDYFIEVTQQFNISDGVVNTLPYSFQAVRVYDEAPGDITTTVGMTAGDTRGGILMSASDEDWYFVDVAANESITFQIYEPAGFGLVLSLYDTAGTEIGSVVSGIYNITFNVGGRYYIGVSQSSEALAEYALNWVDGTPAHYGSAGDDAIIEGAGATDILTFIGNDTISSGAGNDVITTGLGRDIVIFNTGDDFDIVTDFDIAFDRVQLSVSPYSSLSDILAMMSDFGTYLELDLGSGDILRLEGVSMNALSLENFIFDNGDPDGPGPFRHGYVVEPEKPALAEKDSDDAVVYEPLTDDLTAQSMADEKDQDMVPPSRDMMQWSNAELFWLVESAFLDPGLL